MYGLVLSIDHYLMQMFPCAFQTSETAPPRGTGLLATSCFHGNFSALVALLYVV